MPKLRVLFYYVDIGDLYTGKIENLETVQVPNNYSAGCSLHGDVATQGILVGAHTVCTIENTLLQITTTSVVETLMQVFFTLCKTPRNSGGITQVLRTQRGIHFCK